MSNVEIRDYWEDEPSPSKQISRANKEQVVIPDVIDMSNVDIQDYWEEDESTSSNQIPISSELEEEEDEDDDEKEEKEEEEETAEPDIGKIKQSFVKAIKNGDNDTIEFMIKSQQINPSNVKAQKSLLHIAAERLDENLTILGLKIGVDPHLKNADNALAYHIALLKSNFQENSVVQMLYEKTDSEQRKLIPLQLVNNKLTHSAKKVAFLEAAKKLIEEYGADINIAQGPSKKTPLMKACEKNNVELVQYLLEKGANVMLKARKKRKK